jgi:hypothetical protein
LGNVTRVKSYARVVAELPNSGVADLDPLNAAARREELEASGRRVFVLPGHIANTDEFFDAVRATLPLDPPVESSNWNAVRDSLWEGLSELPDGDLAILWPESRTMADGDPRGYEVAREVLGDVARSLGDLNSNHRPRLLLVVLG